MSIPEFSVVKTSLTGFSISTEKELIAKIAANEFSDLKGDFIFVVDGISANREITIMLTSAVNANPYFYTIEEGNILHGRDIFSVFGSMKTRDWNWNYTSLYCLSNLDYCIANQSLNVDINKVPAGSILFYFKGERKETIIPISREYSFNTDDFEDAFKKYETLSKDYFRQDSNYILSLSAGMDSRLLLASLLSKGIRPVTFTMGQPGATDVKISSQIAKDFDLMHSIVALNPEDYLNEANTREIILATSGTKLFAHWHTYIYSRKISSAANNIHLVGSNGEVSRSYYFDKGLVSKMLQHIDMGSFRKIFQLKLRKVNPQVIESIKDKINEPDILNLIESCCSGPDNTSDKLDWFYTFERVSNFIANGMALYNLKNTTISPFLDERFVRLAFSLKRKYKLNSLFHKNAIEALFPSLMKYPFSENSKDIRSKDSNFYWVKPQHSVSYNLRDKVLETSFAKEVILGSTFLSSWIDKEACEKLYEVKNYRTLSFLFTFHHILDLIKEIQDTKPLV